MICKKRHFLIVHISGFCHSNGRFVCSFSSSLALICLDVSQKLWKIRKREQTKTNFGTVDLGAVDLATVDLAAVDLGAVDSDAVDLGTVVLGSVDLATVDVETVQLEQNEHQEKSRFFRFVLFVSLCYLFTPLNSAIFTQFHRNHQQELKAIFFRYLINLFRRIAPTSHRIEILWFETKIREMR